MKQLDSLPLQHEQSGLNLLQGIRVLDLTTSVAGPYATQLLADLGAHVLKIEKPGVGDDTRAWGPPFLGRQSLWFASVNRNKESMTLDVRHPEGRDIVDRLVEDSDVIVLNMVDAVQSKLGLNAARLRSINDKLIHVSLTGFGLTGSRADSPCYDLIAEGYSGVMDLTGEPDEGPQKVGTPAADLLAGQDVALATLAAIIERQRTGVGKAIDVSMVESMVRFMSPRIVPYLGSGEPVTRSGGRDSVIAIYQVFDTADEPITLGLGNDAIWHRFWRAVERPEYGARNEFATNAARREQRAQIVAEVSSILRIRPRGEWLAIFAQHRIPAGPINRVDQVVDDEVLREKHMFYAVEGADGPVPQVGLGIRFDGQSSVHRLPPPELGHDTENVLRRRLGLADEDVARLTAKQII
ncbi:coA-transferase III family protein [Paraburkholderia xenovorans LB400]|uniref:Acyl-CoA transferase n=1 Tax=Paraburkholderia xenovorans (strain LB400) TaxID=266265 RepID=Q13G85_PARXL|nr:CoA transferase [Paraburkholderia xenovorans]ABE36904.1 Putative acyl-CoA transferase [Paraburkholderia xenovorans LB400]AIP35091.1 coA-transferase III family protein [Paraburkholderia xenovorans LB400]